MKLFNKILLTILLLTITSEVPAYFFWYIPKFGKHPADRTFKFTPKPENYSSLLRLKQKAISVRNFVKNNNYNGIHCFLIDMKIPSGKKRFFVYDLYKDTVEMAGLVAHGCGSAKGKDELVFSNSPNSNCTSLGKYKIGIRYMGRFGLAYKLYGLDDSNSKAFERFVVLHAYPLVPNDEVVPFPICESLGCPMVAPAFLQELKCIIDHSEKPILLWIYY